MSDTVYVVNTVEGDPSTYHEYADCRAITRSVKGAMPRARSAVTHLNECGECQKRTQESGTGDTSGVIGVCPNCSSSQVRVRNPKNPSSRGDDSKYWCEDCGHHFNELKKRAREQPGAPGMGGTLVSKLANMDPEDLQGGAD